MDKYFYSIGEVAEILGESPSLVRFWTDSFPKFVRPQRGSNGNRIYLAKDIEMLKQIHLLVKVEGYTLEGAAKRLRGEVKGIGDKAKALESLKAIRSQLVEIRKSL